MTDARLDRLNALIGNWTTTITMLNSDGSAGTVSKGSDIYTWSANGKFVQHDVDADMGRGNRVQSLEVIALDPSGSGYTARSYDPDGTFSDYSCELEGKSWQIDGEVQRFRGEFSEDGSTLEGQWEQNDGKRNWLPLMTVRLRK